MNINELTVGWQLLRLLILTISCLLFLAAWIGVRLQRVQESRSMLDGPEKFRLTIFDQSVQSREL